MFFYCVSFIFLVEKSYEHAIGRHKSEMEREKKDGRKGDVAAFHSHFTLLLIKIA